MAYKMDTIKIETTNIRYVRQPYANDMMGYIGILLQTNLGPQEGHYHQTSTSMRNVSGTLWKFLPVQQWHIFIQFDNVPTNFQWYLFSLNSKLWVLHIFFMHSFHWMSIFMMIDVGFFSHRFPSNTSHLFGYFVLTTEPCSPKNWKWDLYSRNTSSLLWLNSGEWNSCNFPSCFGGDSTRYYDSPPETVEFRKKSSHGPAIQLSDIITISLL